MEQNKDLEVLHKFDGIFDDINNNRQVRGFKDNRTKNNLEEERSFVGHIGPNVSMFGFDSMVRNPERWEELSEIRLAKDLNEDNVGEFMCRIKARRTYECKDGVKGELIASLMTVATPEYIEQVENLKQINSPKDLTGTTWSGDVSELQILHTAKEDVNVFIDDVVNTIAQSKQKALEQQAAKQQDDGRTM